MSAPEESVPAWPVIGFGVGTDPNHPDKIALLARTAKGVVGLEFDRAQAADLSRDFLVAIEPTHARPQ